MFKFEKSSNILNIEENFCSICLKPISQKHIQKPQTQGWWPDQTELVGESAPSLMQQRFKDAFWTTLAKVK